MKEKIIYIATILFAVLFIFIGNRIASSGMATFQDFSYDVERAVVLDIIERNEQESVVYSWDEESAPSLTIRFDAKITRGERKGEIVTATQFLDSFTPGADFIKEVSEGDSVMIVLTPDAGFDNAESWDFMDYVRSDRLFILVIVFAICLLIFGRKRGFNTLLSLCFTFGAIFMVFVPSILSGRNIYLSSLLICAFTVVVSLLTIYGYNRKSLTAAIGCFGGIAVAGIIAIIMEKLLLLTGVVDSEAISLTFLPLDTPINLRAIIFAAIIIGAMGAIIDTALSISTSLWEVKENAEDITFEALMKSGINIGRDMMGTMTNTLILAYIGGSLSIVLLLSVYSNSLLELFNLEMIVTEILQAVVGSLGILFAVPLTSLTCATLFLNKNN